MSRDEFVVPEERLLPVFTADGHVDEGTVHAWLDGAFDDEAAEAVADHVAACAVCAAAVAEARGLIAGSTRVLGALDDVPAGVVTAGDAARTAARLAAKATPPPPRTGRPWWVGIAATAVLAAGGGAIVWTGADRRERPAMVAKAVPVPAAGGARAGTARAETARAGTARIAAAAEQARVGESAVLPVGIRATPRPDLLAMTVVVMGTVRDATDGLPIERAEVTVLSSPATAMPAGVLSEGSGRYTLRLTEVTRGAPFMVRVRRLGYSEQRVTLRATQDTVLLELQLARSVNTLAQVVVQEAKSETSRPAGAIATSAVRQVAASPAPGVAMDFSGRGVAGGIARSVPMEPRAKRPREPFSREQYDRIEDNPFLGVRSNPLSTFSIDVDRASYANVRRFIGNGQRPPVDAVRIEELVNYFPYTLPAPRGADPVSITSEVIAAPWQPQHRLVRITLQATRIETADLPPNNLVFLLDVSGSMMSPDKLPLVKQSLRLLVDQLRPQDRVAIVAYAGAASLVLPSTRGDEKARIMEALDRLEAGGSTAGGAGIELAYRTARNFFLERGNNRVILATDGDFNVGVSSDAELERLIERRRIEGTYLTVLGVGTGNYQAAKMEKLAKVGNGNFAYLDGLAEARKVLVEEMGATLRTVANDVKLQVEFNPAVAQAYRLIGYENRLLRNEDFADDTKDAGDIGAGHQITALYEVVPVGVTGTVPVRAVDSLRYRTTERVDNDTRAASADELLFVKLRYKRPGESQSRLLSHAVTARAESRGSDDLRFAASVAAFGMLLRDSEYQGNTSAAQVLEQARAALGNDVGGYRADFVRLVERWRDLGITSGGRR